MQATHFLDSSYTFFYSASKHTLEHSEIQVFRVETWPPLHFANYIIAGKCLEVKVDAG